MFSFCSACMPCPKARQDGEAAKERLRNAHETRSRPLVALHVQLATTVESLHGARLLPAKRIAPVSA